MNRPVNRSRQGNRRPNNPTGQQSRRSKPTISAAERIVLLFNKPYGVLSQFSSADGHPGLSDYINIPDVYPCGRLDRDSEGLLVLTNDGQLQHEISDPKHKKTKTYWVQIEGEITEAAIRQLATGVTLKDGPTRPAECQLLTAHETEHLWPRDPPIRERKNVPTSWIELKITEGRNRQVRRMTAAAGFPTLRLIRLQTAGYQLGDLPLGEYRLIS